MPELSNKNVEVIVTVGQENLSQLENIATQLERAGLVGAQALAGIGVITGRVGADAMSRLESVEGVIAVERSSPVQIAPPDEPIQ